MGRFVDDEVAALPPLGHGMAAAAQDGPHPPGQLLRVERLQDVVVGPHPEAGVDVLGRVGPGDEDDREVALLAQAAGHLDAFGARADVLRALAEFAIRRKA